MLDGCGKIGNGGCFRHIVDEVGVNLRIFVLDSRNRGDGCCDFVENSRCGCEFTELLIYYESRGVLIRKWVER